ncbi:putative Cell surface metalloreductase (FreA) [Pleurostoma richardsiae]|uniref:Cell surface metalloreductase (FreA) n=1 Tax=Pleurostoma richardsiae TaxID=41990 RepID=A0AA38VAY0_9PEZI|nr:putative Cell surface metalloreductase (FreA) [Pleurostoma richardsiae]
METVQAYAVSWTGLFAVLIFLRLLPLLNRLRPGLNKTFAYINYHATRHLTYRLVRRHAFVGPSTVGSVLLHIAYVAANLVCLIYGASTLSEAAIRTSLKTWGRIHRSAGLVSFTLLLFHVLAMVVVRAPLLLSQNIYAVMGVSALCLLMLLSIPVLRKLSFEIFLRVHQALAALAAYGTCRHLLSAATFPAWCVFTFAGVFLLLVFVQFCRALHRNKAWGKPYPRAFVTQDYGNIRISINLSRPVKVDAGQYINLWMPSAGFWSFTQSHPFVVTSWTDTKQSTLELFIQPRGGFTLNLLRHSSQDDHGLSPHLALISGPHGTSVPVWDRENVLMVAAGFGIAALLPYISKVTYGHYFREVRTRRVHLVWQVQDTNLVNAARRLLNDALGEDVEKTMTISIYYEFGAVERSWGQHANLFKGSPNLEEVLEREVTGTSTADNCRVEEGMREINREYGRRDSELLVLVSATGSMRDSLREAVRGPNGKKVRLKELDCQLE